MLKGIDSDTTGTRKASGVLSIRWTVYQCDGWFSGI